MGILYPPAKEIVLDCCAIALNGSRSAKRNTFRRAWVVNRCLGKGIRVAAWTNDDKSKTAGKDGELRSNISFLSTRIQMGWIVPTSSLP
jgi:hypothetical protein